MGELLSAQVAKRYPVFESYIRKHYREAINQMNRYKIPASITMAQGLVETGAGQSSLARDFNNHFGIKCHSTWTGKRTYKTDDAPNECFRHYDSWQESYEDHSRFLGNRRYQGLYRLRLDDYRGWARGLQTAGYATNKGYANKLIQVIETYELYTLDEGKAPSWLRDNAPTTPEVKPSRRKERTRETASSRHTATRPVYISYGLHYTIARKGDKLERIAQDCDLSLRRLASYNDMPEDMHLQEGDIVYLERKLPRATEKYQLHRVGIGDSMFSISQRYGIRLESLYELNDKDGEYVPEEGDILRLR